jgi:catechol 2,3-dioxygenase-like lactoylglutathione lyase family enzyme
MAPERLGMANDVPPLRGLRHLALRVRDLPTAREFYRKFFGMKVVWEPDSQDCYLSSGTDNLALHQAVDKTEAAENSNPLDHFGFIAETPEAVDDWTRWAIENGAHIVKAPRQHRDGSYSCYILDPDGNTIQILYEPTISRG